MSAQGIHGARPKSTRPRYRGCTRWTSPSGARRPLTSAAKVSSRQATPAEKSQHTTQQRRVRAPAASGMTQSIPTRTDPKVTPSRVSRFTGSQSAPANTAEGEGQQRDEHDRAQPPGRAAGCGTGRAITADVAVNAHGFTFWVLLILTSRLAEEAGSRRVCLLCFEADPSCCRRQVLAERLVARSPRPVHDLVAAPRP